MLEFIEAENLPDFLGGTCTCSHMSGGCVPMKSKDKFKATEMNEKIATVYNEKIMHAARSDDALCGSLSTFTV